MINQIYKKNASNEGFLLRARFELARSNVNDYSMINSSTSPEEILGIDQIQRVFAHWSQLDPMKDLINSKINPGESIPPPFTIRRAVVCVTYGTRTHDHLIKSQALYQLS